LKIVGLIGNAKLLLQFWTQPTSPSQCHTFLTGNVFPKTFILKYEVALSIGNPWIIWVSGPHKNSHDATIACSSQILTNLVEGEKLMADKAYFGDETHFICPLSGSKRSLPREDRARNYMIYSV
jgi:hypothetical protein